MHRIASLSLALSLALAAGAAAAQPEYTRATEGVLLTNQSKTEVGDATALAVNPANLGFLDSWSLTYAGAWINEQRHLSGRGHGLFFAFPVGPLGLGIATEFLSPEDEIRDWQGLDPRVRFSLALAIDLQRTVGLGLAYRTFPRYDLGEIHTLDLALSVRPANQLALAFVVSDVNAPNVRYDRTLDPNEPTLVIPAHSTPAPRRFTIGLTLRPLGNDRLALGSELVYLFGEHRLYTWSESTSSFAWETGDFTRTDVSAILSAMIFDGVTIRGRFVAEGVGRGAYEDRYYVDASLALDFERFGFDVGTYTSVGKGDAQGFEATTWGVRFSGDEAPAINLPGALRPANAVVVKLEQQPDTLGMAKLVQLLERVERDDGVDIVVLRPEAGSLSLNQSQELRRRIQDLRDHGRTTVCYLTEATAPVYLGCAAADHIWMNPAGGARLNGLSTQAIYIKSLLDKVGVAADIVRIGEFKSAPEMFTQTSPTAPASRALNRLLDTVFHRIVANLRDDRGYADHDTARDIVEGGPYTAREALGAQLVDKLVGADQLEDELGELAGGPLTIQDEYGQIPERHRMYLDAPAVAVIHIDGDIIDGKSIEVPFFGIRMTGSKTMTEVLREVGEDARIHAVLLRIDSPGGSALASDLIWREVMALREKKPVIASFGSVAASGAYYIGSAAHEIYSEPTTLTGSIGIYYGKADVSGLLDKIGVGVTTFKRGEHADMESWTRPYTPEERRRLLGQIRQYYNLFLDRVIEGRGRGFSRAILDKRARGRIWSGSDAKHHLLVDELGGYREALDRARQLGNVAEGTRVFHYPERKKGLLMRLVTNLRAGADEPSALELLLARSDLKRTLRAALPLAAMDPGAAQARLPYAIIEE